MGWVSQGLEHVSQEPASSLISVLEKGQGAMPWKELKDVETQTKDPALENPEDPDPETEPHLEDDPVERARMEEEAQRRREELAMEQEERNQRVVANRKKRALRNMLPF